ncbi:MAG TPA: hypothetical protein VLB80_03015 [Candidatus Babeliales bacterium]|nr:hypothetical protein [Candidatus Babeliales bacterium]
MKHIAILTILLIMQTFTCSGVMSVVTVTATITTDESIERFPAYVVSDQVSYVNGGLVFTYPTDIFTVAPTIRVAIETPAHVSTITYTAEITLNSALSATITVYKIDSGVQTEAANGEVIVHFVAAGI